ncbi:MAG: hypothetical protein AAFO58_11445, partial [Pseudomonadota bacterium]
SGASLGMQTASNMQAARAARREQAAEDEAFWTQSQAAQMEPVYGAPDDSPEERARVAQVIRANLAGGEPPLTAPADDAAQYPLVDPADVDHGWADQMSHPEQDAPRGGLRALMPSLLKRQETLPEPELVVPTAAVADVPDTSDDRIKSKIASAIRTRSRMAPPVMTVAQPVMPSFRQEPALTRGAAPAVAPAPAPAMPTELASERLIAPYADIAADDRDVPAAGDVDFDALSAFVPDMADEDAVIETAMDAPVDVPVDAPVAQSLTPVATPVAIPTPEARKVVQHPARKPVQPSARAKAEAQPTLAFEETPAPAYEHPPLSLLAAPDTV